MPKQSETDMRPYIFNQQGSGLAIRNPAGDLEELADISLACRHAISTANLSLKGYIWDVKWNRQSSVVKSVFVKKTSMLDPVKFEAAIDSQHDLPFHMNIGPYRKYWTKFVNEKVNKVLLEQHQDKHKQHYFAEVLGLQIQLLKPGDSPERERWVYGPDLVMDHRGRPMVGSRKDIFWYRCV